MNSRTYSRIIVPGFFRGVRTVAAGLNASGLSSTRTRPKALAGRRASRLIKILPVVATVPVQRAFPVTDKPYHQQEIQKKQLGGGCGMPGKTT